MCTPVMAFQYMVPSLLALVRVLQNSTTVLEKYTTALVSTLHGSKDTHARFACDTLLLLQCLKALQRDQGLQCPG